MTKLVEGIQSAGTLPDNIQELLITEQSRDRFTEDQLREAAVILGFGSSEPLQVEHTDVDDEFVEKAWESKVKAAWASDNSSELLRQANTAFKTIAESRGSLKLREVWEKSKSSMMPPDQAYRALDVPNDVEESWLVMVYNIRVGPIYVRKKRYADSPSSLEKHLINKIP